MSSYLFSTKFAQKIGGWLRRGTVALQTVLVVSLVVGWAESIAAETVKVGVYQNPPKVFVTPKGETTGIFPEVLELIAKKCDWDIKYVFGSWTECRKRLNQGEIDLLLDVAASPERRKQVAFSRNAVLSNWGMIYTREGAGIDSLHDLDGKIVAVMRGSTHTDGARGIKSLCRKLAISCRFLDTDTYEEVFSLVSSGAADAGVVNRVFGLLYGARYGVIPTPIVFNPQSIKFAARKGNARGQALLNQIDRYLGRMNHNSNSEFYRITIYYLAGGREKWHSARELDDVEFTPQEQAWISKHPVIRIGIDPGFPPFEFVDKNAVYRGMAADYLQLIAEKSGLKFEVVSGKSWSESVAGLKQQAVDLLPCVGRSKKRGKFMLFSDPYLSFSRVIVTRKSSSLTTLDQLAGKRVGVQKNSSHHMFLIETTDIKPQLYDEFEDVLLALSRGEVDAAVGNLAVASHYIANLTLANIKVGGFIDDKERLFFGVRKDWPELVSIINRILDSISLKQRDNILSHWIVLPATPSAKLDLTPGERKWLLAHPRIKVGWDRAWAPIEYVDENGAPRGISIEYLNVISKKLGIHFDMGEPIPWQEVDAKSLAGDVDILSCVAATADRLDLFNYTTPYLDIPIVIFGNTDMPYTKGVAALADYRIAVVEGYATDHWVSRDFPTYNIIRTKTVEQALRLLHSRKVDAFVGNVVVGNYYLSRLEYSKIKIVGETAYAHKQCMAVRKDWPVFSEILQKTLDSIPEAQKTSFYRKWVWLRYEHRFDYYFLSKIIMGFLVFLLLLLLWNRRMAYEIKQRRLAEQQVRKNEQELRKSYADLKNAEELRDNLIHMFVHDMRTPLTSISCVFDLLENDVKSGRLNDEISKSLLIGHCSADNLTSMVQAILDINRLENDCMPLKLVPWDMLSICSKAVEMTEVQANYAKQKVIVKGPAFKLQVDCNIMVRVIVNLIVNAIQASPENSTVEVLVLQNDGQAVVEVRDRGCGIAPDQRDIIFDKFKGGLAGKMRGAASVGLGLAFCKLAVEAHGGGISVHSREGGGTVFRLVLPL